MSSLRRLARLDPGEGFLFFVGRHDGPVADLVDASEAADAVVGFVHLTDLDAGRGHGVVEQPLAHAAAAFGAPGLARGAVVGARGACGVVGGVAHGTSWAFLAVQSNAPVRRGEGRGDGQLPAGDPGGESAIRWPD